MGKNNFSSYPDSGKTEEEAKSIAIERALKELKKKEETCTLPTTEDIKLIEERILKIIDIHSTGVFTTQLLKYYKEEYKELLPQNVNKIIKACEFIKEEKGANDTTILTRFVPTTEEVSYSQNFYEFSIMCVCTYVCLFLSRLGLIIYLKFISILISFY